MYKTIDLSGIWNFQLDKEKQGINKPFNDTINLPGTTAYFKKGEKNENVEIGFLTEEYKFEGHAWFSKTIEILEDNNAKNYFLYLERTRVTTVWIDGNKVGTQNSLSTPHIYDVTNYLSSGKHEITILVDNTDYPTRGGHLTSPDTQSNWNGITGKIELQVFDKTYLTDVQVYSNIKDKTVEIKGKVAGADNGTISVSAVSFNSEKEHKVGEKEFKFTSKEIDITYSLGEEALLWSEHEPSLYKLKVNLIIDDCIVDTNEITFGLREFKSEGDKFTINGDKTFLRGKHDGLIFPLTGFAPTTVEEWLEVLNISKSYGINHYRFHTCCPPEAAFVAADILGIYMQPELPFWGTITDEKDENHNQAEQDYLVSEGFSMLKTFGNHPSFVMMSLGNELWGSKERLDVILKDYKELDNRHLYTQGSNNFQFCPVILENDDFFSGVRFSRDRLFRGSYAMCDAPLGHVQTDIPSTMKDYDENIFPTALKDIENSKVNADGTIEIQFGTGTKKVKATDFSEDMVPNVPVVSHEIGQYATFPNFDEIKKYTGPLKARNFETFKQRLEEKGLEDLAEKYFKASGTLAMACYKEELEAAFRSKKLAGFQLLDLQDFSGQGTALVGVLDAFMDSKGLISPEEWRSFCSDAVLMARFDKYNYLAEENFKAHIELCYYKNIPLKNLKLLWELKNNNTIYEKGEVELSNIEAANYIDIADISLKMPKIDLMEKLTLSLKVDGMDIEKTYDLWVYPNEVTIEKEGLNIVHSLSKEAISLLEKGERVVLFPKLETLKNSIEGFYCTDFWCYPMFRSISESVKREVPVGTMGLLIQNNHPIFKDFPCEEYSTYQWWNIVSNSRSIILDNTSKDFRPIVQTIDNFERNHKLGLIFECKVLSGKLLVCTCDFEKVIDMPEAKQFLFSVLNYVRSNEFNPKVEIGVSELEGILLASQK
ncbi:sugar-binding domain-containing protein [Clostridium cellulovorans]|uniref:beta-galactosidase n=2 Tax=Clostridium cellulovorans TaxID=1493 RepID=D9SVV4_CLOC7|nr:sugar-binding domain-containing protein [Clostridium cellulovorans]ADL53165.1 glycoside hydrolase family 2 sugar binding [Clostridium cellulovorans 743B]BAV13119.1 beta-glycosidase [Clostridium cellulovorans]